MGLNRKGFTLVELLVTILIVGLVVVGATFGIIKLVNTSREQSVVISEGSMKRAARTYSSEMSSSSWKNMNNGNDAFCVTVGELMNKGLLDKNGVSLDNNIDKNTYIMVTRNSATMTIIKEEIIRFGDENYNICTGEEIQNGENIVKPVINGYDSYTDKLFISFDEGSSSLGTVSYECLYGISSSDINMSGVIDGNTCKFEGLKSNTMYYVNIYMNTTNGSQVLAVGDKEYKTRDLNDVNFSQNGSVITINYDDSYVLNPSHYFKSSVDGVSSSDVMSCTMNNNIFNCGGNTINVESDIWYKVNSNQISITYNNSFVNSTINAKIYDESNNYKNNEKTFNFSGSVVEIINNSKFSCEANDRLAVYYVTTCNNGVCNYDTKNGLNNTFDFSLDISGQPTWTIDKLNYLNDVINQSSITTLGNTCTKQILYVNVDALNCRTGASTSGGNDGVKKTISKCTQVNAYRTTMKINDTYNWWYNSDDNCYMWGAYLSTSCNSTSGSLGCQCSVVNDCAVRSGYKSSCEGGWCYYTNNSTGVKEGCA